MLVIFLSNMPGIVELVLFGALLYWLFGTSGSTLWIDDPAWTFFILLHFICIYIISAGEWKKSKLDHQSTKRFPMADVLGTLQHVYGCWERKCMSSFNTRGPNNTDSAETKPAATPYSNESRPPAIGLRAFGYAKRTQMRSVYRHEQQIKLQHREYQLSRAKSAPMVGAKYKTPRPPSAMCCSTWVPSPRESVILERGVLGLDVHNVLVVKEEGGIIRSFFKHLIHNWTLPRFHYPQIFATVLKDERVKLAIERAAKYEAREIMHPEKENSNQGSSGNASDSNHEEVDAAHVSDKVLSVLLRKHQKRAKEVLLVMHSKLSDLLLRITSWVLYKVLPIFLTSVIVRKEQVAMLRQAGRSGLPLIFLPLHRSHLDYILMSFILLNNRVQAPLVAAGDNLKIPVFGWLLRGLGAFYIKRKIDPNTGRKDLVYRAILHTYMVENLRAGHNVEFFIEGGRTRTGKACMPKGGLLSVIVDSFMDGVIKDALLVPVSINYERIVDGNFIREQLGQPKIMESFTSATKAIWQTMNSNYGMMRVDFSQPFCLSEFVNSYQNSITSRAGSTASDSPESSGLQLTRTLSLGSGNDQQNENSQNATSSIVSANNLSMLHRPPSSVSLYGTGIVVEEHRNVVENIARHIVYDCCQAMAIMSTNAVAFLLLNKFRNGTTLDELAKALDDLRLDVRTADKDIGFSGDSVDVINHALSVLGLGLVRRERVTTLTGDTIFIKPVTMIPNVIELSYYANTVMNLYCLEAVVATAICSLMPNSTLPAQGAPNLIREVLLTRCLDVCNVMQFEFVFTKPCQSLEQVMLHTIDNFHTKTYLRLKEDVDQEARGGFRRPRRYISDLDDESDEERNQVIQQVIYVINDEPEYRDRLRYFVSTLRPLMEAYAASGACLSRLVGRESTERNLVQEVMMETEAQLRIGFAHYDESRSMDPIRNSLRLLEKWDVLECHTHDKVKLYYLQDEYDSESAVMPVAEKLHSFVCSVE